MRYVIVCSIFFTIISGCTLEVAREAGKAIKSIDTTIQTHKNKKETKKITKQKKVKKITLLGEKQEQLFSIFGKPNLIRKDGKTVLIRFDQESCITYTYFNKEDKAKKVEYFEIRNKNGDLLTEKSDISKCLSMFTES